MKVAIGSKNPTKIEAVKQAFGLLLGQEDVEYIAVATESGVSEQPMDDETSLEGARNRAQKALDLTKSDYAVGLEGGQSRVGDNWYTGTAACVINAKGEEGSGFSPRVMTPTTAQQHIAEGKNLSDAISASHGIRDIGKKEGLSGLVTKGVITRVSSSREATVAALAVLL